jgi:hypothetical protein
MALRKRISKKRSLAAKRGWAKRRAEERKRSAAAKRGWKSRRNEKGSREQVLRQLGSPSHVVPQNEGYAEVDSALLKLAKKGLNAKLTDPEGYYLSSAVRNLTGEGWFRYSFSAASRKLAEAWYRLQTGRANRIRTTRSDKFTRFVNRWFSMVRKDPSVAERTAFETRDNTGLVHRFVQPSNFIKFVTLSHYAKQRDEVYSVGAFELVRVNERGVTDEVLATLSRNALPDRI